MRVFSRVIEEGSFVGAARELNISPAAVSRMIVDLEGHLGTRLINRTTRRMALTEAGARYLARTRKILADLEDAEALVCASTAEYHGLLRVQSSPAFAVHQLTRQLSSFKSLYPDLVIGLSVSNSFADVGEGFDVSIVWTADPKPGGDFSMTRLARSEVIACASPEYLDRRGRPRHPSELTDHDSLISSSLQEVTFVHSGPRGGAKDAVTFTPVRHILHTSHSDVSYMAALSGLGVTALPSFIVGAALCEHRLERILPDWELFHGSIFAVMPNRKHLPARSTAFTDFLVQAFGGGARDPWLDSAPSIPG